MTEPLDLEEYRARAVSFQNMSPTSHLAFDVGTLCLEVERLRALVEAEADDADEQRGWVDRYRTERDEALARVKQLVEQEPPERALLRDLWEACSRVDQEMSDWPPTGPRVSDEAGQQYAAAFQAAHALLAGQPATEAQNG